MKNLEGNSDSQKSNAIKIGPATSAKKMDLSRKQH